MVNHTARHNRAKPAKPQAAQVSAPPAADPAVSKPDSGSKPNSLVVSSLTSVTAEMRRAMIAEAAYFIAAQRGFESGHDMEDWLLAEKQVGALLSV